MQYNDRLQYKRVSLLEFSSIANKVHFWKKSQSAEEEIDDQNLSSEEQNLSWSITNPNLYYHCRHNHHSNSITNVNITITIDAASSYTAAGTASGATSKSQVSQKHYVSASKVTTTKIYIIGEYKKFTVEPYKSALAQSTK